MSPMELQSDRPTPPPEGAQRKEPGIFLASLMAVVGVLLLLPGFWGMWASLPTVWSPRPIGFWWLGLAGGAVVCLGGCLLIFGSRR